MPLLITPRALAQRSEFYYQLASMIRAGLPLIKSLETLESSPPGWTYRKPLRKLVASLKAGETFTSALTTLGQWLPTFDSALLEAGERSGRLDDCFRLLSSYYDGRAKLARDVIREMIYPVIILHLALLIFPPDLLRDAVLQGRWIELLLQKIFIFGLLYGGGAILILLSQGQRFKAWRATVEAVLAFVPLLGAARRGMAISRLTAALEALLNAGVSIVDAWELAAAASGSPAIARTVKTWRPNIESQHETPGALLSRSPVFPSLFASLYHTGELSGQLDDALKRLHDYYREESQRKIGTFVKFVTTAIIAVVMGIIAYQVISFWMEYFDKLNKELG